MKKQHRSSNQHVRGSAKAPSASIGDICVTIPLDSYLEHIAVGEVWNSDAIELSEADIVAFEQTYDPQPF